MDRNVKMETTPSVSTIDQNLTEMIKELHRPLRHWKPVIRNPRNPTVWLSYNHDRQGTYLNCLDQNRSEQQNQSRKQGLTRLFHHSLGFHYWRLRPKKVKTGECK